MEIDRKLHDLPLTLIEKGDLVLCKDGRFRRVEGFLYSMDQRVAMSFKALPIDDVGGVHINTPNTPDKTKPYVILTPLDPDSIPH